MTPEGKVKADVKKFLKAIGAYFYMPVQNGMGVVGIPDIVGCYRGRFFGIETKAPNKTPTAPEQRWAKATPNQQAQLEGILAAGGIGLVADNVQQVIDAFEEAF